MDRADRTGPALRLGLAAFDAANCRLEPCFRVMVATKLRRRGTEPGLAQRATTGAHSRAIVRTREERPTSRKRGEFEQLDENGRAIQLQIAENQGSIPVMWLGGHARTRASTFRCARAVSLRDHGRVAQQYRSGPQRLPQLGRWQAQPRRRPNRRHLRPSTAPSTRRQNAAVMCRKPRLLARCSLQILRNPAQSRRTICILLALDSAAARRMGSTPFPCTFEYLDRVKDRVIRLAAAFCRRERGGKLRDGRVRLDRALAELAPTSNVSLVGAEHAERRVPARSVIQSASRPANIPAVMKNARMSWARSRSLFTLRSKRRARSMPTARSTPG